MVRPSWRYALFYRPFLRFAFARASRIIVASPTLAASAPQLRGWQSKCVVIPYGLEMTAGDAPDRVIARADAIRQEAAGHPIVLFVGRLVKYKGVDVLLEAMRGVSATALLVGNGPERAALQRTAERAGVADRVKFLGAVAPDELAALYRACDLFVLPSVTRQEAFGVVQIEAMACGKPVISTDLGTGTGWVNQHGETGFVVPPHDAAGAVSRGARCCSEPAGPRRFGLHRWQRRQHLGQCRADIGVSVRTAMIMTRRRAGVVVQRGRWPADGG